MKKYVLMFVGAISVGGVLFIGLNYAVSDHQSISPDLKRGWGKGKLPWDIKSYRELAESQWSTATISAIKDVIMSLNVEERVEVQQVLLAPDGKSTLYIMRAQKTLTPTYLFRVANSNNMILEKRVLPD